ncbi:ATP-binding protein [Pseudenhygromyxa sp. WMMC2535]|uniref:ATP-binding protein n=1 Tax=Pseudenhygromyxa sp. WMMC2535 TaxID=2712867 RepID=UPI001554DB03|nr:ATP-binding protein [Pseudenhygromyxa sp. WMMC2535]
MPAQIHETRVDLDGLLKVLGDHLYSTPTVALRELVQNAHDSCGRRTLEDAGEFSAQIQVLADPGARTLVIEDRGAGLTADEIERYLATVGAGYTRRLRQAEGDQGPRLIGYFGLGFLSAFVVAERVEVWTCSYQEPERAWHFSSRDGRRYSLEAGEPREVGTRVTLHLRATHLALANPVAVRRLLARYACLLSVPIFCPLDATLAREQGALGEAVNAQPPPWRDAEDHTVLRQRKLALEFAGRFETDFEPLCTIAIAGDPDSADAPVQGLLWIQNALTYGSSDNRRAWAFVRGMMISDDIRELLPRWAGFVGGVFESDVLTPTASREDIQRDAVFDRAQAQIEEALITGLARLAKEDPASWRRITSRHNQALLGAALCDERLFEIVTAEATLPTSQGDLSLARIQQRSSGRLYVSLARRGGFEELLFQALSVPVIQGFLFAALPVAERYAERRGLTLIRLGTEAGERALFTRVEDDELPTGVAAALREGFAGEGVEVVLSRFAPGHLPFVLVPDREVELKQRIEADEADKRIATAALGLARLFTAKIADGPPVRLHLNLDCQAIVTLGAGLAGGEGQARGGEALGLLRALVPLLSQSEEARYMSNEDALRAICTLAERLAGGGGGDPGEDDNREEPGR